MASSQTKTIVLKRKKQGREYNVVQQKKRNVLTVKDIDTEIIFCDCVLNTSSKLPADAFLYAESGNCLFCKQKQAPVFDPSKLIVPRLEIPLPKKKYYFHDFLVMVQEGKVLVFLDEHSKPIYCYGKKRPGPRLKTMVVYSNTSHIMDITHKDNWICMFNKYGIYTQTEDMMTNVHFDHVSSRNIEKTIIL